MKVYRLDDVESGYYDTLTSKELESSYTLKEIEAMTEEGILFETPYTVRQLNRAKKLRNDTDYCYKFEDTFDFAPDVYDILKHLYS